MALKKGGGKDLETKQSQLGDPVEYGVASSTLEGSGQRRRGRPVGKLDAGSESFGTTREEMYTSISF